MVRWLRTVHTSNNDVSVIDLEHVQSGDKWRVASIEEATERMKRIEAADPEIGDQAALDDVRIGRNENFE